MRESGPKESFRGGKRRETEGVLERGGDFSEEDS